jgi:tetratricopeptide (TPR) repeat protein
VRLPLLALAALLPASLLAQGAAPPPGPDFGPVTKMIEKGELVPAAEALKAILAHGENPRARDLLGVVLAQEGDPTAAETQFRKAAEGAPAAPGPQAHLARLYLAASRPAEAEAALRKASSLGPLDADLALALGEIELQKGRKAEAEGLFRSAAAHDSVRALMDLARLESRDGRNPEALQTLQKALKAAPNSEAVLSAYAQVALAAKAPVPAAATLEALSRMEPAVAQHRYLLGVAEIQAGDMAGAIDSLQEANRLEPNAPLTLLAMGLALNGSKLYGEAKEALEKSLALNPADLEADAALAEAEEGLGELDEAESRAGAVLAKEPRHATANLVLGMVLMKREKFADARAPLERAIAANPASWKAQYQMGLACTRVGDAAGAKEHLELYQKILREEQRTMDALRRASGMGSKP